MTQDTPYQLIAQAATGAPVAQAETVSPVVTAADAAAAAPSPWDIAATPAIPPVAPAGADAWSTAATPVDPASSSSWLDAPANASDALTSQAQAASDQGGFALHRLWDGSLPIETWINHGLDWVVLHFRPFFQSVRIPIDGTLSWVENMLTSIPALAMIALLGLVAWQFAGRLIAIGAVISLLIVAMLGIWPEAMVTLSLVLTSLVFCVLIGLPLGILLAANDRAQRIMRPFLDAMQTTPAFVYLVPVVMLFGIGNVPGVIVTIVFALPPLVRLTNLGIRQVRPDLIEAARAYGASPMQMLLKVQLPLAMPSVMAGVNQSLMLSLSMVVIASMIAVGGLGQMVLRGIGRLDMGLATVGGVGIVLLAITLDRITQSLGQPRRGVRHWWQTGPAGLVQRLVRPAGKNAAPLSAAAPAQAAPRPEAITMPSPGPGATATSLSTP